MNKKLNILPTNLHSVSIGIMLGDGHIYKSSPTSNCRFEMSFGKDRISFAHWVGGLFSDYLKSDLKVIHYKSSSIFKLNYGFRLKTKTLTIFNFYHDIFYEANNLTWKYKKIVPKNISELMDSTVLAYLIMTDGNFDKGKNRIRIYTNSYTKVEVKRLAKAINTRFNIHVGVLHDRKDQWILTIGKTQLDLLRKEVKQHFEPSMLYRIGL